LINGEMYHVVMRAIDDVRLFPEEQDYLRMIHNLFEFNNDNPTVWQHRKYSENRSRNMEKNEKRKLLAEILTFCLMPNHFHLLFRQIRDGGISKIMRKIGAGYGIYYNNKYHRKGHLFQGKYHAVRIKDDNQLITAFVYIHTNPVAILFPGWKENGIKDFGKTKDYLENYRWSSYPDYLGKKNFPSLTSREFLINEMGGLNGCQSFVDDWLQSKKELADFDQIAIE